MLWLDCKGGQNLGRSVCLSVVGRISLAASETYSRAAHYKYTVQGPYTCPVSRAEQRTVNTQSLQHTSGYVQWTYSHWLWAVNTSLYVHSHPKGQERKIHCSWNCLDEQTNKLITVQSVRWIEVNQNDFFLFRPKNKTTKCGILFFGRKINEK